MQDGLTTKGVAELRRFCRDNLVLGYPTVVAIDINGNREIPAVVRCVENVMTADEPSGDAKPWELPRLILVKSRHLHEAIRTNTIGS